jgi:hypothetical protein
MIEECGDFWTVSADIRCITTNGALRKSGRAIMGKGVALDARSKYHDIEAILGSFINKYGNHVFLLGYNLISFPTKYHWKQDSDIKLIERSAQELVALLKDHPARRVLLTRPGCGNGNLKWLDVKVVIQDILVNNKFVVIHQDYVACQYYVARKKDICDQWK